MIVHDDDAIRLVESLLQRAGAGAEIGDDLLRRHEVVPPHVDPCRLEPLHEGNGRGSAHVLRGGAALEGETRDEDLGAHRGATDAPQLLEHATSHMVGEGLVDLARFLDYSRLEVHLSQAVDEDEGVLLEAWPAHEARLRYVGPRVLDVGGVDHLGRGEPHALRDEGDLVGEGEGEVAIGVVDQLDHLRRFEAGHPDDLRGDQSEDGVAPLRARLVVAAHDLGQGAHLEDGLALDGPLRAEGEPEALGLALDLRQYDVSRRPDAHRAAQDDEGIGPESHGQPLHGDPDAIQVGPGFTRFERGAHRDDVDVLPDGRRRGQGQARVEMPGQELVQAILAEVRDAGGIDARDEVVVGVIADHVEARLRENGSEREADVAGTDDANLQGTISHSQLLALRECSIKTPHQCGRAWRWGCARTGVRMGACIYRPPPSEAYRSTARRSTTARSADSWDSGPAGIAMRTSMESACRSTTMSRMSAKRKLYSLPKARRPIWCQQTTSSRWPSCWTTTAERTTGLVPGP